MAGQSKQLAPVRVGARPAEATGEVTQVNVRQRRFRLSLDDGTPVAVRFNEQQEETVTTALKEHRSVRLHVRGRATFSPSGILKRFEKVESLDIVSQSPAEYDETAPRIEDVLRSIASDVPKEEWERLPSDLSDDLDHYLYRTPRR